MSVQTDNPSISLAASATISAFRLVTAAGAQCALDTTDNAIGVAQDAAANGENVEVRLRKAGTCKVTASEAIAKGDVLYKAADGKVSKTATGSVRVGIALEAASGDGSIFEAVLD